MSYTKPEAVLSGSALNEVQSQVKGMYSLVDTTGTSDTRPTNGAYEADE